MDKRLRAQLLASCLLLVPQIGQFMAIRDLNLTHRESGLSILLAMAGIFIIPTSAILSGAVNYSYHKVWRQHQAVILLGIVNLAIALSLAWYTVSPCSWASVAGITIYGCAG